MQRSICKNPYEAKYQHLTNKREKVGFNHFNDTKALWNIQMICKMSTKILKITTQIKKRKVLIVLNDMIADMINNKKTKYNSYRIIY